MRICCPRSHQILSCQKSGCPCTSPPSSSLARPASHQACRLRVLPIGNRFPTSIACQCKSDANHGSAPCEHDLLNGLSDGYELTWFKQNHWLSMSRAVPQRSTCDFQIMCGGANEMQLLNVGRFYQATEIAEGQHLTCSLCLYSSCHRQRKE